MIYGMSANDPNGESFEDIVRSIAREFGRSVERAVDNVELDQFAENFGVDPDAARDWLDSAGSWLRARAESLGDEVAARAGGQPAPERMDEDALRSAEPHPLDLPTEEQGRALAALESGRWTVEPGTDLLAGKGDEPGPTEALAIVRELRVRDWLGADGRITLVGRRALSRWLDAADAR
jgi:hypothetical protein